MLKWESQFWFGGNATDQFVGIANSFQDSQNVEVRKQPRFITLSRKPERSSSGVIADFIMKFITIQSTGDVIAFGDTGKIYRQAAGTGDFVLCYTDTSNRKIVNAFEYNSYLYWATSGHIHRVAVSDIDNSWAGTVTENYKTFANGNAVHHPMIEVYNTLYIGDGKNIATLDAFGTFTSQKLLIFADETVVGITFNGTRIKLYSQRTTNVEYGRFYVWDGISEDYNEFVDLGGKTIQAVVTKDNVDYLLIGVSNPGFYAMVGYSLTLIKQLPSFADGNTAIFNPNAMTSIGNLILFGTVAGGTNSINRGVWSFGAKDKEYPQVLANEYTTSNGNAADLVATVHFSNGRVYFSWKNGSTYGVDIVNNSLYAGTGYLVSRAWDGGLPESRKTIQAVKLAFKQLAAGEKIELFLRRDLATSWGTAVLTADYAVTADRGRVYKELGSTMLGQPANFLEYKVVLTAGTSNATTPAVCAVQILMDPIQEVF